MFQKEKLQLLKKSLQVLQNDYKHTKYDNIYNIKRERLVGNQIYEVLKQRYTNTNLVVSMFDLWLKPLYVYFGGP
jgi:hypothetical protein